MNSKNYSIVLVCERLTRGGAERSLVSLANHLASSGHKVTILPLLKGECAYEVNENIEVIYDYPFWRGILCVFNIRRIIKRISPDIVISFLPTSNTLTTLALRFTKIPLIISERCNHKIEFYEYIPLSKRFKFLCKYSWRFADKFVVQTEASKQYFSFDNKDFKIKPERIRVIPNAVRPVEIKTAPKQIKRPAIIALGRFEERKGFHLLIDAFSQIADKYPEWSLVIHGYGDYETVYRKKIEAYRLEDRAFLPGMTKDAYAEMTQGDIYVMTSFFEGFPNSLMEAMASGLPCVSFDFEYGANELIRHGDNGLLVPLKNVDKLADAIEELICDPEKRKRLGKKATEIHETLRADKVFAKWDALIEETIREKYRNKS